MIREAGATTTADGSMTIANAISQESSTTERRIPNSDFSYGNYEDHSNHYINMRCGLAVGELYYG